MKLGFAKVANGATATSTINDENYFAKINKQDGRMHIVISSYRQPNLI